jgi:trans-aconitate 2-methyltransferase
MDGLELEPESLDLVFSNAALHWSTDQQRLFARLSTALVAGGQLAVQMPANFDHPSHTIANGLAHEPPFFDALQGETGPRGVLAPEAYASLLYALGFRDQHVRIQVYPHVLSSREAVLEWVRGTLLTFYKARLRTDLYDRFVAEYERRVLDALCADRPFFYPFKRLLMWARR